MRCQVKACAFPAVEMSGLCAIHLRDGVEPFRYNAPTMSNLNANDSIQTSIREAENKAAHHAAQIATHESEQRKWEKIAKSLREALRLSGLPADQVESEPIAANPKSTNYTRRERVKWMEHIEKILADPGAERPTRKELVRALKQLEPERNETTIYQSVLNMVNAGRIKVYLDKCYLPSQMDGHGHPHSIQ